MDDSQFYSIESLHKQNSSIDLFETLNEVFKNVIHSDGFQIYFRNEDNGSFDLFYSSFETNENVSDFLVGALLSSDVSSDFFLKCDGPLNLIGTVQLEYKDMPYGVVTLHSDKEIDIDAWKDLLTKIGVALGPEIIKIQLFENATSEAQLSLAKLQGIHVSLELIKDLDLDTILMKLMGLALKTMGAEVGSIMILENDALTTKTDLGFSDEIAMSLQNFSGEKYVDLAFSLNEPTVILDTKSSDQVDVSKLSVNLNSIISIPLRTQKDNLGLLHIINNEENFDQNNFEVLQTICNLSSYALENAILYKSQLESARLKEAMQIAQEIHMALLPKPDLKSSNVEIFGWSKACDETGGDYYDLIEIDENRVEIIVGDATGHGIGAAQTMLITRSSLRTLFQLNLPLKQVFEVLNNRIAQDTSDEKFMTLFCGSLNPVTRMLSYCSAGHDGPLVVREGMDVLELEATGVPLGLMDDIEYETVENIQLQKGDLIMFGSDGTWEAMNENNEEFGKNRILDIMRLNADKSAVEINSLIQAEITSFIGKANIRDDMTLIIMKIIS